MLQGKTALIVGVANEHSIAYGCAQALRQAGAELCITYQTEKHRPYVEPLLPALGDPLFVRCDVTQPAEMDALFEAIRHRWGRLDILLHSIAFARREDLHGRVTDSSAEGFLGAMDVSCHSFIRLVKRAEPLMTQGGSAFTMTYLGSERVVEHYGVMGPVKAALESATRYLAAELGPKGIRVNAVSPGPLKTRAASGIREFERLLAQAAEKAPTHQLVTIEEVGRAVAFLASEGARNITGQTLFIDGGYHIMG